MTVTNIVWVEKQQFLRRGADKILAVDVILDVGAGIQPQNYISPCVHICVEPHLPYIERLKNNPRFGNDPRFVFLNCGWEEAVRLLPAKSVDTVFATDVIEHWEKEDGVKFLLEAERIARHQIVILTPLGFYPQSCQDPNRGDIWGMDGGEWQAHRSGWHPDDFGPGWEIIACESFHMVDEYKQPLEKPHGAFWALRTLDGKVRRRCLASLAFRWTKQRLRGTLNPKLYQRLGTLWNRIPNQRGRATPSKHERQR